jgi:hypothetical protein
MMAAMRPGVLSASAMLSPVVTTERGHTHLASPGSSTRQIA